VSLAERGASGDTPRWNVAAHRAGMWPHTARKRTVSAMNPQATSSDTGRAGLARPRAAMMWGLAFAGALVLYVATLAPGLVWQDGGEYQYTSARLSWPPTEDSVWCRPGEAVRVHPWFLVTAHLLDRLGPWDGPYAANLTSAISMALAVANVLVLVYVLTDRRWAAVIAATGFAVGHTVWRFAVLSEVLGWAAAFLSAECLCFWAWRRDGRTRWLLLLFLLNGVALSNHLMAAFSLLVFGAWTLGAVVRRRLAWWTLPAGAACWLAGGTLYWIVLALEYGRTGSLVETLVSATVGGYGGQAVNLAHLPRLFGRSVLYVGLNYPTPLALAGLVGVWTLWRRRDSVGRVVVILAAVYCLWAARYRVPDQYSFFVPFYVPASVLIGVGTARLLDRRARWLRWAALALALLPVAVYAVLPAAARRAGLVTSPHDVPYRDEYRHFLQPWQCGEDGPRRLAEAVFSRLPERAVMLADSTVAPPLVYVQVVEGRRPDVFLASVGARPPYLSASEERRYWRSEASLLPALAAEGRRVFLVSDQPGYMPGWVLDHTRRVPFGPVYEVLPKDGAPAGEAER